jgi:hypothetical protein
MFKVILLNMNLFNNKVKYFIVICVIIIGFTGIYNLCNDFVNVYPKTDKLKQILNSDVEYGDDLKYVKIKGKVNNIYKMRFGVFVGIKATIFEYTKDSIFNEKVFYKDKKNIIWFYQRHRRMYLRNFQKGDFIEKYFGELRFNKSNDIK